MKWRALPPVAAPSTPADLPAGLKGALQPKRPLEAPAEDIGLTTGVSHVSLLSSGRAALTLIRRAMARGRLFSRGGGAAASGLDWFDRDHPESATAVPAKHIMSIRDVCLIAILTYILAVFYPAFREGPLLQTDEPLWAASTYVWAQEVGPSQKWVWGTVTDRSSAGLEIGNSYSASIIVPSVLSSVLGPITAVKVSMVVSALLFLVAFHGVARTYIGDRYALFASVLLLSPVFDNLVSGMWYNYLALACALAFWRIGEDYILGIRRQSRMVLLPILFAGAIYCHPIGAMTYTAIWGALVVRLVIRTRRLSSDLLFLLAAPGLGVLLAAPQCLAMVPVIYGGSPAAIQRPALHLTSLWEFLRRLLILRVWGASNPGLLQTVVMAAQALLGLLLSGLGVLDLWRRNRYGLVAIGALFCLNAIVLSRAFVLVSPLVFAGLAETLSDFYDRLQLVTQIYMCLLAVAGIRAVAVAARGTGSRTRTFGVLSVLCLGAMALGSLAANPLWKIQIAKTGQLDTLGVSPVRRDVLALWKWIDREVPPETTRIYFEDTYGRVHWNGSDNPEAYKTHIFALTSIYTRADQVGGWCGFTNRFARRYEVGGPLYVTNGLDKTGLADGTFAADVLQELRKLNCRYVVAVTKALKSKLSGVEGVRRIAEFGSFWVFEHTKVQPAYAYSSDGNAPVAVRRRAASSYAVEYEGKAGQRVYLSLAYHPEWVARMDGRPVPLLNSDELMSFVAPRDGHHRVLLEFERGKAEALSGVGLGLIGLCAVVLASYRKTATAARGQVCSRCSTPGDVPEADVGDETRIEG